MTINLLFRVLPMDIALRRLQAGDVGQIVEIEREAFAPVGIGTPFKRELNNRYACYLVAHDREEVGDTEVGEPETSEMRADSSLWGRMVRGVQGVMGGEPKVAPSSDIAGYVGVWFQGNEAHITEIAVRVDLRGQGIGELLLIGSVRAAIEYGSSVVTLEARVSNFIAQRLYEKYDFKSAGIRKGYYADNREDAIIMTTSPLHTEDYQQLFRSLQEVYLSRWGEICIED